MQDRVPATGKAGRIQITLDDSSTIDGILAMNDDATVQGTAWNTANVLSSATAALFTKFGESAPDVPNDAFSILATKGLKFTTGTYTGSGNTTSPRTLNFDFTPLAVFVVLVDGSSQDTALMLNPAKYSLGGLATTSTAEYSLYAMQTLTWTLNSVSWTGGSVAAQMEKAKTYSYFAIGY